MTIGPVQGPGEFGDLFGGTNALFSGLAFVGVVIAILIQSKELELQRKELSQTRVELKGQKEWLEAQARALQQQVFENSFFQLVRLHQASVNSMDIDGYGITGSDCFAQYFHQLENHYNDAIKKATSASVGPIDEARIIEEAYQNLYSNHHGDLGHYFRRLYHIIRYVDESTIDNKSLYSRLVRSQLSAFELLVLFYNCISRKGSKKFKPLVERYSLLKNIPDGLLFDDSHSSFYSKHAFGG